MKCKSAPFQLLMCTLALLFVLGCKRDKCKRVTCVQGVCVDGSCDCNPGYEGSDCGTASNLKFGGNYDLEENCTAGADVYEVKVIIQGSTPNELLIMGLWEQSDTVSAMTDGNYFTIGRQILGDQEIAGDGSVDIDAAQFTLNLDYRIYSIGNPNYFDQCTATLVRQ